MNRLKLKFWLKLWSNWLFDKNLILESESSQRNRLKRCWKIQNQLNQKLFDLIDFQLIQHCFKTFLTIWDRFWYFWRHLWHHLWHHFWPFNKCLRQKYSNSSWFNQKPIKIYVWLTLSFNQNLIWCRIFNQPKSTFEFGQLGIRIFDDSIPEPHLANLTVYCSTGLVPSWGVSLKLSGCKII